MPDQLSCKWRKPSGDSYDCTHPRDVEITAPIPNAFVLHLIVNRCDEPRGCAVRKE